MKDPVSLQVLSTCLGNASNILAGDNPNTSGLREIQKFIFSARFLSSIKDDERFMMFFLDSYIEKIFFNLVGDVPYQKGVTKEIQTQFYKELSVVMMSLKEKLDQGVLESAYPLYERLGILYIETVVQLNNGLDTKLCNGKNSIG